MLILYFWPGASSVIPHIVLEEIGTPYQRQLVNLAQGEHKSDTYLKINPHGKVPALGWIVLAVGVGTVALSLIGAIGAALTLGIRRSGTLLSLLTLPLSLPVLIFGARATQLAIHGAPLLAPLELLGALAVFGLTLAPLAVAAAVRISLE
jgi:hypothetical protein